MADGESSPFGGRSYFGSFSLDDLGLTTGDFDMDAFREMFRDKGEMFRYLYGGQRPEPHPEEELTEENADLALEELVKEHGVTSVLEEMVKVLVEMMDFPSVMMVLRANMLALRKRNRDRVPTLSPDQRMRWPTRENFSRGWDHQAVIFDDLEPAPKGRKGAKGSVDFRDSGLHKPPHKERKRK